MNHFFNTLMRLIVEFKLDGDRVFNMDETGFAQKANSRKRVSTSLKTLKSGGAVIKTILTI